eukprot:6094816-Pleurochrysis_carterae.AAC.1
MALGEVLPAAILQRPVAAQNTPYSAPPCRRFASLQVSSAGPDKASAPAALTFIAFKRGAEQARRAAASDACSALARVRARAIRL